MRPRATSHKILIVYLTVFPPSFLLVGAFCFSVKDKSFCYFHVREPSYITSWSEAWEICRKNGSSLPSIESREIQKTFVIHLQKQNLISDVWLAGQQRNASEWQWSNGKIRKNQEVAQTGEVLYNTRAVIRKELNSHPRCQFEVCFRDQFAANTDKYICQYPDISQLCKNSSAGVGPISLNGRCFVVYNEEINSYEAINRCFEGGGNLANLEDFEDDVQKYLLFRDRLVGYRRYWIGLRKKWWIWKSTDSEFEMKYSEWSSPPVNLNEECVSIGPSSNYKWKQRNCTDHLQLLCQEVISSSADEQVTSSSPSSSKDVTGFAVGLGVGLPMMLIIVIIGAAFIYRRRNLRKVTQSSSIASDNRGISSAERTRSSQPSNMAKPYEALQFRNAENRLQETVYQQLYLDDNPEYEIPL